MLQVQVLIYQPQILLEEYVNFLLLGTKFKKKQTDRIYHLYTGYSSHCRSEDKSQNQVFVKEQF
jgi:hypothetical protein